MQTQNSKQQSNRSYSEGGKKLPGSTKLKETKDWFGLVFLLVSQNYSSYVTLKKLHMNFIQTCVITWLP